MGIIPIQYNIDPARRIVMVRPRGSLTSQEITDYQHQVWTRPDLAGYNELVDMTEVTDVIGDTISNIKDLAQLSGAMDPSVGPSKLAIVAIADFHYGMGRMYKAFREDHPGSTKQAEVFRVYEEATRWLCPNEQAKL